MTGDLDAGRSDDRHRHGVESMAETWARSLHRAHYVPLGSAERRRIVTGLTERLVAGLLAEPFDPGCGYAIGADLVAAGFAAPEALGRTIAVINSQLPADLGLPADRDTAARLTALLEGVAIGFSAAAHDRSLRAQDEVRLAALTAQERAERALRANEARFRHLATHDPLTGLPNRTLLAERLEQLFDAGPASARVGMCCVDLDGFGTVNDALGPEVGDRVLIAAAERLRPLAEVAGHLVARLEGDQFAILVADTTCAEDAAKVADRALAALAEPFRVEHTEVPLTASAGVVERAVSAGGPAELVRAAQIASRWAKDDGKARWRLFDGERSAADAARYRLSAALPAALRHGEFTLVYQPLVNLRTGRLDGAEALARWRHPRLGLLGADHFITLAEQTGLIVPLGLDLLEQACRQASAWPHDDGPERYVSVNVAVRQLHEAGLVGALGRILDRTGLPAERLQLEITERAVIELSGQVGTTLAALAELGVRIVIDDFGIGYANLANLRALPLHGLKLDASFARLPTGAPDPAPGRERVADDAAFLATVVALGHTLGLTVTAEGIERADQARRMRAAGCDRGQGWHFGRPVPAAKIAARMAAQRS